MKKDAPKDKSTMTAQEVAVLIEDLRSQFRTFGEGLASVREDLSAVKEKVDAIFDEQGRQKEDIFAIREDVKALKLYVAEIKELLKNHEERLSRFEAVK